MFLFLSTPYKVRKRTLKWAPQSACVCLCVCVCVCLCLCVGVYVCFSCKNARNVKQLLLIVIYRPVLFWSTLTDEDSWWLPEFYTEIERYYRSLIMDFLDTYLPILSDGAWWGLQNVYTNTEIHFIWRWKLSIIFQFEDDFNNISFYIKCLVEVRKITTTPFHLYRTPCNLAN